MDSAEVCVAGVAVAVDGDPLMAVVFVVWVISAVDGFTEVLEVDKVADVTG